MNVYEMCVNNIARELSSYTGSERARRDGFNAFDASEVLAVAFCKSKEEVLSDIVGKGIGEKVRTVVDN